MRSRSSSVLDVLNQGRLEEVMAAWQAFRDEPGSDLLLAELELSAVCVDFLIEQSMLLPTLQRPRRMILQGCKYGDRRSSPHSSLNTAQRMVEFFVRNRHNLSSVRLESAYVGHLPVPTVRTLLHGIQQVASLETVELIDIDLRVDEISAQLESLVASAHCRLGKLMIRHCRLDEPTLWNLSRGLASDATVLESLVLHACVLDDALLHQWVPHLATGHNHTLRHLALPCNRLTAASLPALAQLLQDQPCLRSLDLQRMGRLFCFDDDDHTHLTNFQNLVQALVRHPSLRTLDWTRSGVTDPLVEILFQRLEQQQQQQQQQQQSTTTTTSTGDGVVLENLLLDGNDLTGVGWLDRLARLSSLQTLDVPLSVTQSDAWLTALQRNTSLTVVQSQGVLWEPAQPLQQRNRSMQWAQRLMLVEDHLPLGVWPALLARLSHREAHGATAVYSILQTTSVRWI